MNLHGLRHCLRLPQVAFHNERTEEVGKDGYRVRVPKTATVGQLLEQVRQRVGEAAGTGPLRLLEVRDCRICQARALPSCQLVFRASSLFCTPLLSGGWVQTVAAEIQPCV